MISLFKQRKPRPYYHRPIYSDERKDRLKTMEEKARQELGMTPPREVKPEDFRGVFSTGSRYRQKKNAASLLGSMPTTIMIVLIAALLLFMLYLSHN